MTILVAGFGPFLDVADNPAATLARAVDGHADGDVRVIGRVMPVSYRRGPDTTLAWVAETGAQLVLGIGVARTRTRPMVERFARRALDASLVDIDGQRLGAVARPGPDVVESPWAERWSDALGVPLSDDAGRYVCNGWLYAVLRDGVRAAFLHVPPSGLDVGQLRAAAGTFGRRASA